MSERVASSVDILEVIPHLVRVGFGFCVNPGNTSRRVSAKLSDLPRLCGLAFNFSKINFLAEDFYRCNSAVNRCNSRFHEVHSYLFNCFLL